MEHIKPGVVIDGETYYPPAWVWVLAYAIAGHQWAIDEIESGKYDGWLWQGAYI